MPVLRALRLIEVNTDAIPVNRELHRDGCQNTGEGYGDGAPFLRWCCIAGEEERARGGVHRTHGTERKERRQRGQKGEGRSGGHGLGSDSAQAL